MTLVLALTIGMWVPLCMKWTRFVLLCGTMMLMQFMVPSSVLMEVRLEGSRAKVRLLTFLSCRVLRSRVVTVLPERWVLLLFPSM